MRSREALDCLQVGGEDPAIWLVLTLHPDCLIRHCHGQWLGLTKESAEPAGLLLLLTQCGGRFADDGIPCSPASRELLICDDAETGRKLP